MKRKKIPAHWGGNKHPEKIKVGDSVACAIGHHPYEGTVLEVLQKHDEEKGNWYDVKIRWKPIPGMLWDTEWSDAVYIKKIG